jgi:hypothetical protein
MNESVFEKWEGEMPKMSKRKRRRINKIAVKVVTKILKQFSSSPMNKRD